MEDKLVLVINERVTSQSTCLMLNGREIKCNKATQQASADGHMLTEFGGSGISCGKHGRICHTVCKIFLSF